MLFIQFKDNNSLTWELGEAHPLNKASYGGIEAIEEVSAHGEELVYLDEKFKNIPILREIGKESYITFHGDLAKFIISNLLPCL